MTSDGVRAEGSTPGGMLSRLHHRPDTITPGSDPDDGGFEETWRDLQSDFQNVRTLSDVDARLGHDLVERAIDVAIEHPDKVDVTSRPYDATDVDMRDHVLGQFRMLFEDEGFAPRFQRPTDSDFQTLLRAGKVAYIDDAVLRFTRRWVFESESCKLGRLTVNELLPTLSHWMEQAQLMWDALEGRVGLSRRETVGLVESLYGSRAEFVETATDRGMFLPVPPKDFELDATGPNLRDRFKRRAEISPEDVHAICYRSLLDGR